MKAFERFFLLFLVCFVVFGGCSSNTPKHPEDHARFTRIVQAVESLRNAYVGKDLVGMKDLMLPLEGLDRLQREVTKDFESFSDISLEWSIERINIQQDLITVFVRWQGTWKKSPDDVGRNAGGHGILEWSGNQVILLASVGGDLPFGMATRQIGS